MTIIRLPRRAVRVAFLALAAANVCWAPLVSPATAGDLLYSNDIECRLKLKRCKGIAIEPDPRIALPAIQFEFDSDRLTHPALAQIKELGKALGSVPSSRSLSFAVQGHTDSKGSEVYNRALSLRRARAVKRYLTAELGVSAHRLIEVGLGEIYPLSGVSPEDERNRRVEIVNLGRNATPGGGAGGQARALLIGIDEYRHVSRLAGPVNDAKSMASFAVDRMGFRRRDVKLLLDADATRDGILAAIEDWLIQGTAPGDEVLLYFSGHGFQQPDGDGDEEDRLDETLVPVDALVEGGTRIKGMITDDEVAASLARLSGRRVHVVIDACHSGTSTRSVGSDWRYVKTPRLPNGAPIRIARTRGVTGMAQGPQSFLSAKDPRIGNNAGVTVWTAVRAEQKALVDQETTDDTGSVFTRRLLWGARDGKADRDRNGVVTTAELHEYVVRESRAYCERHPGVCGHGLTPQLDTASAYFGERALGAGRPLPRNAALAKDILLLASDSQAPAEEKTKTVRLRMDPGSRLALGDELNIVVESDRKGHLVLLDINAAGNLVQIFPNERSIASGVPALISAGRPVRLPGEQAGFRFRAVPPVGRGLLVAVVSKGNAHVRKLVSRHKDLSVVQRPGSYLVEIGEALRVSGTGADDTDDWRIATLTYEVVPPGSK